MDDKKNDLQPTQEELKAEDEATKQVNDEELTSKVAEKFGIDPNDEDKKDLLAKLVENEKEHHSKLSTAIRQKRDWRTKAQTVSKKDPKATPGGGNNPNKSDDVDVNAIVDKKVQEALEKRDLKDLNLPEELEIEVKDLAKLKGISVREAVKLPYIQARKTEIEKAEAVKKATPHRSNNGSYTPNIDPTKPLNPKDFALDTPEGQKAWREAKEARRNAAK